MNEKFYYLIILILVPAYFGLGTGYLASFDYDNAIRYLNFAKARFESLGNTPRYCGTLRVLSDCYERLNKRSQAMELVEHYQELENELRKKLTTINFKLNDLRERYFTQPYPNP